MALIKFSDGTIEVSVGDKVYIEMYSGRVINTEVEIAAIKAKYYYFNLFGKGHRVSILGEHNYEYKLFSSKQAFQDIKNRSDKLNSIVVGARNLSMSKFNGRYHLLDSILDLINEVLDKDSK